jgi:hypothetical protein
LIASRINSEKGVAKNVSITIMRFPSLKMIALRSLDQRPGFDFRWKVYSLSFSRNCPEASRDVQPQVMEAQRFPVAQGNHR